MSRPTYPEFVQADLPFLAREWRAVTGQPQPGPSDYAHFAQRLLIEGWLPLDAALDIRTGTVGGAGKREGYPAIPYDVFVKTDYPAVIAAYVQKNGHQPGDTDFAHLAWRLIVERWTVRDMIHSIMDEPLEDGGHGGAGPVSGGGGGSLPPLAGRIRVGPDGLFNDAGPWMWFGLSDFDLLHLARTGQRDEASRRMDAAVQNKVRIPRVFATADRLFGLHPDMLGYDEALVWLLEAFTKRGLHMEFSVFQDAQLVYPDASARTRVLRRLLETYGRNPCIVWALANEPSFNGWSGGATDPALLKLAELAAQILGHKDFLVGDPPDGDDEDASEKTIEQSKVLAKYCNILCLHPSRKLGAATDGNTRLRRWVDHLEGASDIVKVCEDAVGRSLYLALNEPMGHASIRFVPLDNGKTYEREYDPDVAVAAGCTAIFSGLGYTYHRIATQNPGTPGLAELGALLSKVPVGPGWRYLNDSWANSPTKGFTWKGKVRHWTNGQRAYSLAYGLDANGTETWANGFSKRATLYESPADETGDLARSKVSVYEASR